MTKPSKTVLRHLAPPHKQRNFLFRSSSDHVSTSLRTPEVRHRHAPSFESRWLHQIGWQHIRLKFSKIRERNQPRRNMKIPNLAAGLLCRGRFPWYERHQQVNMGHIILLPSQVPAPALIKDITLRQAPGVCHP